MHLDINPCQITGLCYGCQPIWFCGGMDTHRQIRNLIIYFQSCPHDRRQMTCGKFMGQLQPVSECKPEITGRPVQGHIRKISKIHSSRIRIEKIHLHLKSKPFAWIVSHYRPDNNLIIDHSLPIMSVNGTILHKTSYMPFPDILADDIVRPYRKCIIRLFRFSVLSYRWDAQGQQQ